MQTLTGHAFLIESKYREWHVHLDTHGQDSDPDYRTKFLDIVSLSSYDDIEH